MKSIDREIKKIRESIEFWKAEKEKKQYEQCFSGDAFFDTMPGFDRGYERNFESRLSSAQSSGEIAEIDRQIAKFEQMLAEKIAEKEASEKQRAF